MRRKTGLSVTLPVLIALITLTIPAKAQDGFFSDAQTLQTGRLSLGIQPIIYTESEDLMLNFRTAYGVQPGLTIHGKIGAFRDETYFGGHLEYQIAGEPQNAISFALLGGVYSFGDAGLKLSGVISKQLDPFSLYSGVSYEPLFSDPAYEPVLIPVGVDIPLGRGANFVMEADLVVNDEGDAYQSLHFGFNFYL